MSSLLMSCLLPGLFLYLLVGSPLTTSPAAGSPLHSLPRQDDGVKVRCLALECYVDLSHEQATADLEVIRAWVATRPGIRLKVRDLSAGPAERERLQKVLAAHKANATDSPVVYGLNRVLTGPLTADQWAKELESLVTMQVFVRQGCSKCASAKAYLPKFQARYPGLRIEMLDAVQDPAAGRRYNEIARTLRVGGVSFPGFWLCRQLVVGFDNDRSTGERLDKILQNWTYECEIPQPPVQRSSNSWPQRLEREVGLWFGPSAVASLGYPPHRSRAQGVRTQVDDQVPDLPLPDQDTTTSSSAAGVDADAGGADIVDADEIEVPWLGRLSATRLGMPAFTFLIGLVDGFNPCAMWVLLFLLSILVNLQDRWKIFAVAGTFVLVSGVAYYAFMAAWLNVLLFVGYLRWVQILLAALAIFVGSVHVKDFFAFKQGLSLSIPDSAKPGLYARVRKIVLAEHLSGAIAGAMVLAILVNFIELLCTAGLPALYSQVLTLQDYPAWKNYAYLALYILAYMLDDSIMVGIVIWTLGKRKLQETEGRWLKLLSGAVILALGFVLLFKPEWLS
jgi:hypothetical protein